METATARIATALKKAQELVEAMAKSGQGPNGIMFVPTEQMIREGRRCLLQVGLVLNRTATTVEPIGAYGKIVKGNEVQQPVYKVRMTYRLESCETGEWTQWDREQVALPDGGFHPLDKAIAGAETFDLGYAIRDLLMIPRVGVGEEVDLRQEIGLLGSGGVRGMLADIEQWTAEINKGSPKALESLKLDYVPKTEAEVEELHRSLEGAVGRFRKVSSARLFLAKLTGPGQCDAKCDELGIPRTEQWQSLKAEDLDAVCEKIRTTWGG